MSKKAKFFVLLALVAVPFAAIATGCSAECVDDTDCLRKFGLSDAGTLDYFCSNDNTCVKGTPTGTPDGGGAVSGG